MQGLCVTATRDHNVYASFRPSIATKDVETRSKMNTERFKGQFGVLCPVSQPRYKPELRIVNTDNTRILLVHIR